ncbi:MAG: hypothetical protein ACREJ3_05840 [Polyangiaceae bacterium]
MPGSKMRRDLALFGLLLLGSAATGCKAKVGDACALSTDCAIDGTRVCDTSQPGGYCTLLNCTANTCPDNAACVMFQPSVPGCPYSDYQAPSRTARVFCMAACGQDSDCRQSEGYVCRPVTGPPWNATILDQNKSQEVCVASPGMDSGDSGAPEGAAAGRNVCNPAPNASFADGGMEAGVPMDAATGDAAPPSDAAVPMIDAGSADAAMYGGLDADADADAEDATLDAGTDAAREVGAADGAGGG